MRILFATISFFLLTATSAFAAIDTAHVGFVRSTIWFDREPFFSSETVRIYTILANSTSADFKGVVTFYDGEEKIDSRVVTLEKNGGFQTVWADWIPGEGDHNVRVGISDGVLSGVDGESPADLAGAEGTQALDRFVDSDTDGDGIGNLEDLDDDGDGILDVHDKEPLIPYIEPKKEELVDTTNATSSRIEEFAGSVVKEVASITASTSPKVRSGVATAVHKVEEFRVTQNRNISEKTAEVKGRIAAREAATSTEGEERKHAPFDQIQLLALSLAGFTLSNKVIFYIACALIALLAIVKLVPWIYRKVRGETF